LAEVSGTVTVVVGVVLALEVEVEDSEGVVHLEVTGEEGVGLVVVVEVVIDQ
jgi:hypothetical protein